MPTIRWSNGQADRAATWEELEELIRVTQWWVLPQDEFRVAMQKRAMRWSLTEIATYGDSQSFIEELHRAQLVEIIKDTDNMKEEA